MCQEGTRSNEHGYIILEVLETIFIYGCSVTSLPTYGAHLYSSLQQVSRHSGEIQVCGVGDRRGGVEFTLGLCLSRMNGCS